MKLLLTCAALCLAFHGVVAPPVTANKKEDSSKENEVDGEKKGPDWDIGLEYNRYLQEVVQALESDPQFRDKLEKAEVADIRTGKIASELDFVNHNVRSKLDELKRQELERLRHLAIKQFELSQQQREEEHQAEQEVAEGGGERLRLPHHVDHKNPHSFEVEDLRKLIVQTTKDLEEADRKRREDFKEYEMQKEFEKQQQLNLLDEEHKKEMEQKLHEQEEKHKKHPSLHHPGSKPQLEQVWEEQDHMNPDDFNPKTFFHLHDLDGNGVWDADEVKTLFQKELDKMYDPNAPEDDMRERREEMERMREHVFNETDINRDQLISYQEFLDQTKRQEFEQDQGWEGLDNQKVYTHEEYQEFEHRRQQEVQRMIDQGLLPPQPDMHLPYGMQVPPEYLQQQHQQNLQYQQQHHPAGQLPPHAQQQFHPNQGGVPYQYHGDPNHPQQQQGFHPQQGAPVYQQGVPPQQYNQPPPMHQQGHPNAVHQNIQQGHPNIQHPNAGIHQNIQQGHPNAIPQNIQHPNIQQQGHPNAIHQQGHPNIQQQGHPNAVHQNIQQGHPNAVPHNTHKQGHQNAGHHQNAQQAIHQNAAPVHNQQYQEHMPNKQLNQHNDGYTGTNRQYQEHMPNKQLNQHNEVPIHNPAPVHQNPPSHDNPAVPASDSVHAAASDTEGTAKLAQTQQQNPQEVHNNVPQHV